MTFIETAHPRDRVGKWTEKEHTQPEAGLGEPTREQEKERYDNVSRFARHYASRFSMDDATREDIVQTTILDVLGQQRRGTPHTFNPAFLNRATRAVAQRYLDPDVHHTTLTGRRELKAAEDIEQEVLGRSLLPGERDRLADQVRMSFPAGRRPKPGFHIRDTAISLDTPLTSDGSWTLGDTVAAEDNTYGGAPNAAAATLDALEGGDISVDDARAAAWTLLAGADAPPTRAGVIRDPAEHLGRVKELGGALAAAEAWQSGNLSPRDTATLFWAFDVRTDDDRRAVVEVLARHRNYADDLYASALQSATDTSSRSREYREKADKARAAEAEAARLAHRTEARRRQRAAKKAASPQGN